MNFHPELIAVDIKVGFTGKLDVLVIVKSQRSRLWGSNMVSQGHRRIALAELDTMPYALAQHCLKGRVPL